MEEGFRTVLPWFDQASFRKEMKSNPVRNDIVGDAYMLRLQYHPTTLCLRIIITIPIIVIGTASKFKLAQPTAS